MKNRAAQSCIIDIDRSSTLDADEGFEPPTPINRLPLFTYPNKYKSKIHSRCKQIIKETLDGAGSRQLLTLMVVVTRYCVFGMHFAWMCIDVYDVS